MNTIDSFKSELKELLTKYDATIHVGYGPCSDTHGMHDEHMYIELHGQGDHFICHGWGVSKRDITI